VAAVPTYAFVSLPAVAASSGGTLTGSPGEREELAKAWLLRLIERGTLADARDIPLDWIAREAPPLIADILGSVSGEPGNGELVAQGRRRAEELAVLRSAGGNPTRLPRELASLQTLLIEALEREIPEGERGEFGRAVGRLAEAFGDLQTAVLEGLVRDRSGDASNDQLTGLPGASHLHEWLRVLLAEHRRYKHPFALALVDIDGLKRINDAHGREVGDRLVTALAETLRGQIRSADRVFRLAGDEFCVIAPHQEAETLKPLAERLVEVVVGSQPEDAPPVGISVGLASCPSHGESGGELLGAAEQAVYTAKAAGQPVAVADNDNRDPALLQDS
jgi:diguanylate cyclase (GGDEF)-like protein